MAQPAARQEKKVTFTSKYQIETLGNYQYSVLLSVVDEAKGRTNASVGSNPFAKLNAKILIHIQRCNSIAQS